MVDDLKTTEQKVAYLVSQVPATRSNYKLLLLLYWQIFDGIQIPSEIVNAILEKGTEPESLGRLKRKAIGIDITYEEVIEKLNKAIKECNNGTV